MKQREIWDRRAHAVTWTEAKKARGHELQAHNLSQEHSSHGRRQRKHTHRHTQFVHTHLGLTCSTTHLLSDVGTLEEGHLVMHNKLCIIRRANITLAFILKFFISFFAFSHPKGKGWRDQHSRLSDLTSRHVMLYVLRKRVISPTFHHLSSASS